jgi:hypothetical protein
MHVVGLFRLAIPNFTAHNSSQICRSYPVLLFAGQNVIGHTQQLQQLHVYPGLFPCFPDGTSLEGFEEIDFTTDNAPAACFRRPLSECQQYAVLRIHYQHANTDTRRQRVFRAD